MSANPLPEILIQMQSPIKEASEFQMDAINLVDGLIDREVSFSLFRTALHQNELSVSQGWERTAEKLVENLASEKTHQDYSGGIKSIYRDLTLYGDKIVRIFSVDQGLEALHDAMVAEFQESDSPYSSGFPLPLEKSALLAAPAKAYCVACWKDEYATNFIVCSKQYVTEREEIPSNYLTEETVSEFGEFDQIYGVRKRAIQLFDVIAVRPSANRIEVRMDGLSIQRADEIERRFRAIKEKIMRFSESKIEVDPFAEPVNFFPAIKKLYEAKDGRIGELGHSTEGAAIHYGKMRRKIEDFRKDKYHVGGVDKIPELNAYLLSKRWDSPTGHGTVELLIPGSLSTSSQAEPTIEATHALSCASREDYEFLMEKLFQALQS